MNIKTATTMFSCYGIPSGVQSVWQAIRYYHAINTGQEFFRRSIYDYEMLLDTHDPGISKTLAIFGKRELEHRYILQQVLKPGMCVWDLGANIGYYAIMEAKLVGPSGYVYCVEPSPANVAFLKKNITLNNVDGSVDVSQVAISNACGEHEFYLSEESNVNTFHPASYRGEKKFNPHAGGSITVETIDVPSFLQGKKKVDLVRMDIEGHEVEVFESIIEAIDKRLFSARILFETHFLKYNDKHHNMREKLKGLFDRGYLPSIMASSDERKNTFKQKGYEPKQIIRTDGVKRGLYYNVSCEDAISIICDLGGVRTVLLEPKV